MSRSLGRMASAVSAAALLVGGLPVAATADPAGCGGSAVIGVSGTGLMGANGEAGCGAVVTRTWVIEIKQDIQGQPDPLVAKNSQQATTNSYFVRVTGCDHGKTARYYGRAYFTTNTTYHDTASNLWHVC
jgi:hypothetical protein